MNQFVLMIRNKETLTTWPWCCASSSQGPSKIFLYFDKVHPPPSRIQAKTISPYKVLNGSPSSSSIYPKKMYSFSLSHLWLNAFIYSAVKRLFWSTINGIIPLYGWDSSLIDGIRSSLIGIHEPSGGVSIPSNRPLECSRSNHK